MKDEIRKLIDEKSFVTANFFDAMLKSDVIELVENLTKWNKVSESMPNDVLTIEPKLSDMILIRTGFDDKIYFGYYSYKCFTEHPTNAIIYNVREWKQII